MKVNPSFIHMPVETPARNGDDKIKNRRLKPPARRREPTAARTRGETGPRRLTVLKSPAVAPSLSSLRLPVAAQTVAAALKHADAPGGGGSSSPNGIRADNDANETDDLTGEDYEKLAKLLQVSMSMLQLLSTSALTCRPS